MIPQDNVAEFFTSAKNILPLFERIFQTHFKSMAMEDESVKAQKEALIHLFA